MPKGLTQNVDRITHEIGTACLLDSILKSIDITLPKKVRLVKAMVFPLVMYGCELDCEES